MGQNVRTWCLLAAIGVACVALGCEGLSHQQSAYQDPTNPTVRSSPWPSAPGAESHGARIDVQPHEATNPVRTQHVFIATLTDDSGAPRHGGKIEWMLEGAGHIVDVDDEGGLFSSRGAKVSDKYAVSYTASSDRRISRGTGNPADDFVIRAGQSWCVITSATEGDSNLTVYAPEITNWNLHKVFVVKHWVDAEWTLPPPAVSRAGTDQTLTTHVFRHTDREPLSNYRVRYRILDGPPAGFGPSRAQELVATTDQSGAASVRLAEVSALAGVNHIGIEIVRPPRPCAISDVSIVIGKGETTQEWQASQITLTKAGPADAAINAEVPYSITVANVGKVESREMTVHDPVPDGLAYVRSDPAAIVDGTRLTWTLPALQAGASHVLHVYLKAGKVGTVTNTASVITADGLKADSQAVTRITEPKLAATETAPMQAIVGVPATFTITVTNPGTGPATNVVLRDDFDKDGLEHDSKANPVELRIGELPAGNSRSVPLTLTPKKAGLLTSTLTATADGNLKATAQATVTAQTAKLTVTMSGPRARYAQRPANFAITVANAGQAPLSNVMVRDLLPRELAFVSASDQGQLSQGPQPTVSWNLGTLKPGETRALKVNTKCLVMSPQVVNAVSAAADPGQQSQANATMEIRGLPAYRLEVSDSDDPIEVGANTTYTMDVTNQGSLPGNGIVMEADVPAEMRIVAAHGPTAPRYTGQHVSFAAVDGLQPKQALRYTITVQPVKPGDLRFRASLTSSTLKQPVIKEESTTVIDPNAPPAPKGEPAMLAPASK